MKLIAFSILKEASSDAFTVTPLEDGLRITQGDKFIDLGEHTRKPLEMQYLMTSATSITLVPQDLYVDSRDWASVMKKNNFDKLFGAVYYGTDKEEPCLVLSSSVFADGVEPLEHTPAPYAEAAASVCESAAAVRKRNKAKMTLVEQVNPLDSLAALEKQADLMLMLLLNLALKQPSNEQPDWLPELDAVLQESSSVNDKEISKAIKAMGDYKARVRDLQQQYFNDRSTK